MAGLITPEERTQIEQIRDTVARGLASCRAEQARPDPLAPPEGYGETQSTPAPDLSRCAGNGSRCGMPPVYVTWVGCEHEHVGPVPDCEQHARQLTSSIAQLVCGMCGSPMKIMRTEPELPPATGMNDLISKIFGEKP